MDELFSQFWAAYPKRSPHSNPKKPALRAFTRLVKSGVAPEDIVEGAEKYAKYCKAHVRDRQFIAMAATFLNQERFADFADADAPVTLAKIIDDGDF